MEMAFELPELDRKRTQAAVEAALEKYRIFKTITVDDREASMTASYSDMPRSNTGVTSDQTGSIAIHNVEANRLRKEYCERVERAVSRLDRNSRIIISERYMKDDDVFDYQVYNNSFDRPMSESVYYKRKWKAFYKLALILNIQVVKE